MTILDVAAWLDLSWDTVKEVVKKRLEKDCRRIGCGTSLRTSAQAPGNG